jgi:D-arginine dehydrogenase
LGEDGRLEFDIAVIGGGIAGASAAAEIARKFSVVLIERESQPGYHATGRSAALFSEIYGNEMVRRLSKASRGFMENPPEGFASAPILSPRGALHFGGDADIALLETAFEAAHELVPSVQRLDAKEILRIVPVLKPENVSIGVFEPDARDIDTNGLLQGFLRQLRALGGEVLLSAEVTGLTRQSGGWNIRLGERELSAKIVVNAAGAWGDHVAEMVGAAPIGLTPKRRTAFLIKPPASVDTRSWPLVIGAREDLYFKPDAGLLLVSPADETPSAAMDAQPEDMDIAIAADRLMTMTNLEVTRIEHKWAGLRTFAADKTPVAGFDPAVEGFFWLVGQGGYGFQTASALSRVAGALLAGDELPSDLQNHGITSAALDPARFSASATRGTAAQAG